MTEKLITKGTVAKFYPERQYGFLIPEDSSEEDVFVHQRECPDQKPLKWGEIVQFTISHDHRGRRRAVNVQYYHPIKNDPRESAVRFGDLVRAIEEKQTDG
jgi:cold shock CspA family protein